MNMPTLWQLLGLGGDLALLSALEVERLGRAYTLFLRRVLLVSGAITAFVLFVLVVALIVDAPAWVYAAAFSAVGLCAATVTVAGWPVLAPMGALLKSIPALNEAVQRPLRWAGSIVFGVLWLCAISLLPVVRANPSLLLLLAAAVGLFTLASFVGVFKVRRETVRGLLVAQLFTALASAAVAIALPETFAALGKRIGQVDPLLGKELSPGEITLEAGSASIDFFSPNTGRPQIWYVQVPPDGFRLYREPRFDTYTGKEADLADTPEEVRAIQDWLEKRK